MTKKKATPKKVTRKPSAKGKRSAGDRVDANPRAQTSDGAAVLRQPEKRFSETLKTNAGSWVQNARSWLRDIGPRNRMPGVPTASAGTARDQVSISGLVEANRLVERMGSIDAAKATLDVLAKLK